MIIRRIQSSTCLPLCLILVVLSGCRSTPEPENKSALLGKAQQQSQQARQLSNNGRWSEAEKAWNEAAITYALLNRPTDEASSRHNQAVALRQDGQFERAHAAAEKASELNAAQNEEEGWWRNQISLLQIDASWNRSSEVDTRIETLTEKEPQIKSATTRALFLNEVGLRQMKKGSAKEAVESFHRAVQGFWRAHEDAGMATALANRARAYEALEKHGAAERDWEAALSIFMQQGDAMGIATAMLGQGRTLFRQSKSPAAAQALVARAADNFQQLNAPKEEAEARRLLEANAER